MDRIGHTIANRTSAAVVCWIETPFVVLATGQSWTFGFSKLELMGEPIEKLTGPLSNLSLVQHAIMNTSNLQSAQVEVFMHDKSGESMPLVVSFSPLLAEGTFLGCLTVFRPIKPSIPAALKQISYARCLISANVRHSMVSSDSSISKCQLDKNDLRHQQASEHVSLTMRGSRPRSWSTMLDYGGDGGDVENWRRGALERPCYAIDTTTSNNLDVAISTPVPQQPSSILHDIILPPLILPPSMIGGIGHGEKVSVPSWYEPEAARAVAAAPAYVFNAFTAADPKRDTCCQGSTDFSTAGDSQAATFSTAALHIVFPAPSCRPTVTGCCKPKDKLAAATVLTPTILAALQGQPLPAAARSVGMSATAFKRACRRLGTRRWGFRRGPGRRRLGGESLMERSGDAAAPV